MAKTTAKAAKSTSTKKVSVLVPDAKGNYPFKLYSVKQKVWVDVAKSPLPTLASTGRGAYMCKGFDADGNTLAMIVSNAVAENWVSRKLAEYAA